MRQGAGVLRAGGEDLSARARYKPWFRDCESLGHVLETRWDPLLLHCVNCPHTELRPLTDDERERYQRRIAFLYGITA